MQLGFWPNHKLKDLVLLANIDLDQSYKSHSVPALGFVDLKKGLALYLKIFHSKKDTKPLLNWL